MVQKDKKWLPISDSRLKGRSTFMIGHHFWIPYSTVFLSHFVHSYIWSFILLSSIMCPLSLSWIINKCSPIQVLVGHRGIWSPVYNHFWLLFASKKLSGSKIPGLAISLYIHIFCLQVIQEKCEHDQHDKYWLLWSPLCEFSLMRSLLTGCDCICHCNSGLYLLP